MHPRLSWLVAFLVSMGLLAAGFGPGRVLAEKGSQPPAAKLASFRAQTPAQLVSISTCYTWVFLNNTGQDATGLVVNLKGIPALTDVYTGVLNPFGVLDPTSGYDPNTGVYSLVFNGGTAYNGDVVQTGICSKQPALRLDTGQPAFYWLIAGVPAVPAPLFAGLDFNWIDSNHLQVHLTNEQSTPLTAFSLSVLTPDAPLSLDDLNHEVTSILPTINDLISDPIDLAGGANTTFDIFFDQSGVRVPLASPIILEAVLSAQDDPGNSIRLLAQISQPFIQNYLPLVR